LLKFGLPGGRSLEKTTVSDRCFNLNLKMTFAQDVYFTLRMTCTQKHQSLPTVRLRTPLTLTIKFHWGMKDKGDIFNGLIISVE